MKTKQTKLLWALPLLMLCGSCSDDENTDIQTETVIPISLSIGFPERSTEAESLLPYEWTSNDSIAALQTDDRTGIDKINLGLSNGELFTGDMVSDWDTGVKVALLYPGSASTVSNSEVLTQSLSLDG